MALASNLKDAAYVTVGLGVLGFQRAQVRRQEIAKNGRQLTRAIDGYLAGYLAPVRAEIDHRLDMVEQRLPARARSVVSSARYAGKTAEAQLRSALGLP